jgi:adenylate cyclase
MSDVVISYARSTAKQAHQVAEALRSLGHGVWLDDQIPAHRAFTDEIDQRLTAAKAVVVIWSADAVKSQWVQSEADRARQDGKLVQLRLDSARLPMPFDRIQCADLMGWTGDLDAAGWRKVLTSVSELTGSASAPSPLPMAAAKSTEPLLAVLAFDNLSGDADMAYFSDGISEEILQTVARSTALKVIGRGSSFQFRGADKAAARVATSLKATHVLDGTVRRSGNKVRISANLIECAGETTLWSRRFDRELSDVFALQDDIAEAVAAALRIEFARAVPAETVDPAAYDLYLKAREALMTLLSAATRVMMIELLEQATNLAPKFARAWAMLAEVRVMQLRSDEPREPYSVMCAKVVEAAGMALKLDPSLGEAHQTLSQLKPFGAYLERETLQRRALSVAPNNPTVLTSAALFFAQVGRVQEALKCARQANDLDPMFPWSASWCATMLDYAGRHGESRLLRERCLELWPDSGYIAWHAIASAVGSEDWDWFGELVKAARDHEIYDQQLRGVVWYGRNLRDPAAHSLKAYLEQTREDFRREGTLSVDALTVLYRLGFGDEVFNLVDEASFAHMFDPEQRSPNRTDLSAIFSLAHNGGLMRDPRFPRLCGKLGLCDYWVATDRWPDCADEVPYDFRTEARRLAAA